MIIRRKHTANFTTIGNALFNDQRLKADEIGIIGYLLSRPHDWEVRRPQLAKRFGYGREAIKRVVWNGMRFGWIVAQKTRLADGRLFTIYEIRDEPGPELSDEEIRRALSLESSEAGDADSDGDDPAEQATGDPPDTGQPAPGEPATGQPATGNSYVVSKEETTKYGFTKDEHTKGARAFADVKIGWPPENILSETASQRAFFALSDADKEACFQGQRPYLADCNRQKRKVCDLRTYIDERRWERFPAGGEAKPSVYLAKLGTPQFYRWKEHLQARGEWTGIRERRAHEYGCIAVASEWPPATELQKVG
jgi:hypothetical protein